MQSYYVTTLYKDHIINRKDDIIALYDPTKSRYYEYER